jgi:hypothetical protein
MPLKMKELAELLKLPSSVKYVCEQAGRER